MKQVSEQPVPPMDRNPAVPPALDAVVMHALEKDPANRYPNADAFIEALLAARAKPQEILAPPLAPVVPIEEELEEEDRRARRWWLWLLVLLALAAIAFGLYQLLTPTQVAVPNVIGRHSATASQILQNRGFEVDVVTVTSATVPRDEVAGQSPRPGVMADKGSLVTINVSGGPGQVAVPSVEGTPSKDAQDQLKTAGLKSKVEKQFSDTVPRGKVISASPSPGTTVDRGTTVTLQVSRGKEQVSVPGVTGETEENARSAIEGAGLRVGKVTQQESDKEPGTVLTQSPAAGKSVAKGSAVDLTVAKAVKVPDVVDKKEDEARTALEAAGFTVKVRQQAVTDPAQDGVVLDQTPGADEERPKGSRVTIIVGQAPAATPTPTVSPTPTATP
jgi:serine/threonine-protein kinase